MKRRIIAWVFEEVEEGGVALIARARVEAEQDGKVIGEILYDDESGRRCGWVRERRPRPTDGSQELRDFIRELEAEFEP